MDNFRDLTSDNSLNAVPDDQVVSGWRIAQVLIGVAIGLPMMLTGAELALKMEGFSAIPAFFSGGLILGIMACLTGVIGSRERVSTYVLIERTFGVLGAKLVNLVIVFSIFAWFAVTANVFGKALQSVLLNTSGVQFSADGLSILGVALMAATSIFGFKALDKLAVLAVPLLAGFLVYVAWAGFVAADMQLVPQEGASVAFPEAVSMVVGSFIVGIVIFPDFCRYARRKRDSIIAALVSMGIGIPVVLLLAAIPALAVHRTDIIDILYLLGLGAPVFFLLVFATWTTNASNLYSGALGLKVLMPKIDKWKLTLMGAAFGAVLALSGIADNLSTFLLTLGVAIPPVAGIYIVDNFFPSAVAKFKGVSAQKSFEWTAFVAWIFGSLFGILASRFDVGILPSLDALIVSMVCYLLLRRMAGRLL